MRFLHRRCVSKQALRGALDEVTELRETAAYWENQYYKLEADVMAAGTRHEAAVAKLANQRDGWKKAYEAQADSTQKVANTLSDVTLTCGRMTEERDDARAQVATQASRLVDLRDAGVLTRDDIVAAVQRWAEGMPDSLGWHIPEEDYSNLVDALLAAQRKPTAQALQSAVEAATEGVTQEVGE